MAFLAPTVTPRGDGTFTVQPGRPATECTSAQAAKILGIGQSSLSVLLDHPVVEKYLRWRWTSPRRGKRLFEVASLYEYIRAARDPEFGADQPQPQRSQASRG